MIYSGAVGVLAVGTRRAPRDRDELHRTVHGLVELGRIEEPDELPYYLKNPREPGMGAGWWWKPAGAPPAVLGANVFMALRALQAHANESDA